MEVVRQAEMSINQSPIHFNAPHSSLYKSIKRIKAAEEAGESYDAALAESGPPPDGDDVYVHSFYTSIESLLHLFNDWIIFFKIIKTILVIWLIPCCRQRIRIFYLDVLTYL